MSAAPSRARGALAWVLGAVGLLAVAVLGGQSGDGEAFDPSSTEPDGTKALVLLLEELGAEVDVSASLDPSAVDVVVVARNQANLDDDQLEAVEDLLDEGGTVVVTDPFSPLTPPVVEPVAGVGPFSSAATVEPDRCDIDTLAEADSIEVTNALSYDTSDVESSCYGDGAEAFVTDTERDGGHVVAMGGTTPFTNEYLDQADNAVVAANLMAPEPGLTVVFLEDAPAEPVAGSPFDLLDPGVGQAVAQLAVAFVVFALWKARRLGRPLRESQPVDVAGSELVAAVGDLLQRTRQPSRAATLLRDDVRRSFCERLGLPVESSPDVVAGAVEARTGVDRRRVERALSSAPPTTDDDLLTLARELESLRQEVLHGQPL